MLIVFIAFFIGIVAGALIFRNNQTKVERTLTDAEKETIRLKKAGRYLLDVLKGRNSDDKK
jgi:uncharacterized membrane-anchored protein YhcB (DUF1043 family)